MHNTRSPFNYLDDTTQRSMLPETSKDAKDSPNSPHIFPKWWKTAQTVFGKFSDATS
jgi:hypothetical protein